MATQVRVRVIDQKGEEFIFVMDPHIQLNVVFSIFSIEKGSSGGTGHVFLCDGRRLNPEQTVQEAGLDESKVIEAYCKQVGG